MRTSISDWIPKLVFPVLMSLYMSLLMTGLITWLNTGLDEGFGARWVRAFYIAWPIAFLLVYFGGSRIRSLSDAIVSFDFYRNSKNKDNLE